MLSVVHHGPVDLALVALEVALEVDTMAVVIQKPEGLAIGLDEGPAPPVVKILATVQRVRSWLFAFPSTRRAQQNSTKIINID